MNRRCWGRSTVLGWMRGHVPHVLLGLGLTLCYLGVLSVPNNRALGDSSTTVTPPGPGVPCSEPVRYGRMHALPECLLGVHYVQ